MRDLIINSLKLSENLFHKNELAFLSLTSKIENPIRDALAYQLFNNLGNNFLVSREWNRTDIAILENDIPRVIIELKAMYSFDALIEKNILNYLEKVNKDFNKTKKYAVKDTSAFFILLATHPFEIVKSEFAKVVKYSNDINRLLKYSSELEIKETAKSNVLNYFSNFQCVSTGELVGGKAFEIETNVLFWVFQEQI